jgi:hypothetical protein
MHFNLEQVFVAFVVGWVLPSRFIWTRVIYYLALWTGQETVKRYVDHHFYRRRGDE